MESTENWVGQFHYLHRDWLKKTGQDQIFTINEKISIFWAMIMKLGQNDKPRGSSFWPAKFHDEAQKLKIFY